MWICFIFSPMSIATLAFHLKSHDDLQMKKEMLLLMLTSREVSKSLEKC